MKKIMVKVFRDIPSSALLMIGFSLTIFISMVCCGLVNSILNSKESDIKESCYMNIYHTGRVVEEDDNGTFSYIEEGAQIIEFDTIYSIMKKNNINFHVQDFVHIGDGQEEQKTAVIIYSFNETIPFSLESGYIDWSEDERTVIIGESIKPFMTRMDNENYLYVNGVYYKVTGVAENNGSGGYDSSLYFVMNSNDNNNFPTYVREKTVSDIMNGFKREITVYGNDSGIEDNLSNVKAELENNYSLHVDIDNESSIEMTENKAVNFLYRNLNMVFMPLLFLFSIGSCYSITSLWVKVRRTEIAIRITYGFGKFKMYMWIMKEIGILLGISLTVSVSMRVLYLAAFGELYTLSDNIIYDILIVSGGMLITLVITSFGAYKYSKSIIPAVILKEL
ncbi:MAG: hypothetical protein HDT39_15265 [Lachnospiraceae bacterium]|nr:hypothetical protein [Lachnospiraceae bacterium]